MSATQNELVNAAIDRAYALIDYDVHNDIHKWHEFYLKTILADKSLAKELYDQWKLIYNEGTKRICENCQLECLVTLYCEYYIRNYLKSKFSSWISGNDDIDDLIQKCQMKTIAPDLIVEWVLYNNLQNIEYLTKGGCSEIYTADWVDRKYDKWDPQEQKLKRYESHQVILKKLENVESTNQIWFEEVYN